MITRTSDSYLLVAKTKSEQSFTSFRDKFSKLKFCAFQLRSLASFLSFAGKYESVVLQQCLYYSLNRFRLNRHHPYNLQHLRYLK